MALKSVELDDKYTKTNGRVYLTGNQALVRLPLLQKQLDLRAGLNTAGFISGYRGSPLGTYDLALWKAKALLNDNRIVFQPGVNEDLAATAVWGTQQLDALPDATADGVFAIWYGKGPGVDRSGDALKHGNITGTHRHGGVLAIYGDDHPGKSSSIAHQSEHALAANNIPSFYPADLREVIEYGLLGWAMSRYTGLWTGLKTVNETVEQTATVAFDLDDFRITLPEDGVMPEEGVHYRPGQYTPQLDEMLVMRYKLPLVHHFVRANGLDRVTVNARTRCLGLVSAGKTFKDVEQALDLLGIDAERAESLGVSLYKVGCIWPLEPVGLRTFAEGQQELLVIEEKKAFLEDQVTKILYNLPQRPRVIGKQDENGVILFPSDVQLESVQIALTIAARLAALGVVDEALQTRVELIRGRCDAVGGYGTPDAVRLPYFCSGCPHNTSTNVPDGSFAGAGIGCHGMSAYIRPKGLLFSQMGGEGITWTGMSHFTKTPHIFQNIGDGTYYHSGLLAIRAAVAAGSNITYKILYNDAVSMTGGQPVDGPLSVGEVSYQVLHEGVKRCVVVSDTPEAYNHASGLAPGVEVYHRDELDAVQRQLRDIEGCTVLIYEQTCAAEKRRRRKRGEFPDPARRAFINHAVCEGCGDCSVQANCVSIMPHDTELGRKRKIDQSSCNKDFSCVKGFCPSFVTVSGGRIRKPEKAALDETIFEQIPPAPTVSISGDNYGVMVSGIGGTGVVTVTAVLGMAAHLENKACSIYDMTGMAQKNGAVLSHLRIAEREDQLHAARLGVGEADLVLGFDMVAALSKDALQTLNTTTTRFIGNSRVSPTAAFQSQPDLNIEEKRLEKQVVGIVGQERAQFLDATGLGLALMGDSIATNMFVVGYALQRGLLPVTAEAVEKAIELNGVAIAFNQKAFRLGRVWAWQPELLKAVLAGVSIEDRFGREEDPQRIVDHRVALLTQYQNAAWAARYRALVSAVQDVDAKLTGHSEGSALTIAVARNFAKLMAYKDEYEVARLYASDDFKSALIAQFEGDVKLRFHLAPPLLSRRDPITGHLKKREFGGWMLGAFRLLAKFKGLRGTALDLFGYTQERRDERQWIGDYEQMMGEVISVLSSDNYQTAVELAELPDRIRGYGHVKEQNMQLARQQQGPLLQRLHNPVAPPQYVELKVVG